MQKQLLSFEDYATILFKMGYCIGNNVVYNEEKKCILAKFELTRRSLTKSIISVSDVFDKQILSQNDKVYNSIDVVIGQPTILADAFSAIRITNLCFNKLYDKLFIFPNPYVDNEFSSYLEQLENAKLQPTTQSSLLQGLYLRVDNVEKLKVICINKMNSILDMHAKVGSYDVIDYNRIIKNVLDPFYAATYRSDGEKVIKKIEDISIEYLSKKRISYDMAITALYSKQTNSKPNANQS